MADELTLRDIKRIERLETKAKRLTKLEKDFFLRVFELIDHLKREYKKAKNESPESSKTLVLGDDLKKIESLLKDIYARRERKVVLLALESVNGATHDLKLLSSKEKETFNYLVITLSDGRNRFYGTGNGETRIPEKNNFNSEQISEIRESIPSIEKNAKKELVKETEIVPKKEKTGISENIPKNKITPKIEMKDKKVKKSENEPESKKTISDDKSLKESSKNADYKIIRILEDIPSFVAFDLKSYNLSKEDVVTLPKENAEFLCENRKAEEIIVSN